MSNYDVYKDIAERTNGDIYVGVVGPVRTGKSTFISKLMNKLVIPNILDQNSKLRTIDELPQSGDGKSIMTTQPRFIPNSAVKIALENDVVMKVRLIDCVGYLVEGAVGHLENNKPRLVNTPWEDQGMPFEQAAELGTQKVISDHSTIGVLVTTDGSITDLPRVNYVSAEERVVAELKKHGKPFVIVLNSTQPASESARKLRASLEDKYNVPVVAVNVAQMEDADINNILASVLNEFVVVSVDVKLPEWMQTLPYDHSVIQNIVSEIVNATEGAAKIGEFSKDMVLFENSVEFEPVKNKTIDLGRGTVIFEVVPKPHLFYGVLSGQCGCEISSDFHLMSYVKQLSKAKMQYDKFKDAIDQVKLTGYGVVHPTLDELALEEPQIVKQGNRFGVKLKASAPSLHIMRVDIETEVNPVVGSEQQSEELVNYLLSEFEHDPKGIWETKMFGKSLNLLVNEGLQNKLSTMPQDAQRKLRKTLGRIVNEGKGGVICILL